MTREEAIQLIDEIASSYYPCDKKDALEMAIKALEPCEDTISRGDALKALDYDIKSFEFKSGVGRHMNEIANLLNTIYEIQSDNIKALPPVQSKPIECEDAISRQAAIDIVRHECGEWKGLAKEIVKQFNGLPPVQPKPKTGHWIFDEILDKHYYCSECKSMGVDYWDYCPYCGARMVEPQESEDKE